MNLILEYITLARKIDDIRNNGYDDAKEVRKSNTLVNRLRAIACDIEKHHPEAKADFYQLLFQDSANVRLWVAHHILEVMDYSDTCRKTALKEISLVAKNNDGPDGLGNKMWLDLWLKEHPKDKKLL